MNHTERIAYIARQQRHLTQNLVREVAELYLEALAQDIASGEWIDIPRIGKMQVLQEETRGTLTSFVANGRRELRKPGLRLVGRTARARYLLLPWLLLLNPGS